MSGECAWCELPRGHTSWCPAPHIVVELRRMADEVEASETDNLWGRRELRSHADEIERA